MDACAIFAEIGSSDPLCLSGPGKGGAQGKVGLFHFGDGKVIKCLFVSFDVGEGDVGIDCDAFLEFIIYECETRKMDPENRFDRGEIDVGPFM